jgi:hypothetical protein
VYAIGGEKYQSLKAEVAERILKQLPDTMRYVESYAEDAMNVRNTLVDRMQRLSPEEFEGMLRPAFKEDEWSLIIVGAVLVLFALKCKSTLCSSFFIKFKSELRLPFLLMSVFLNFDYFDIRRFISMCINLTD